MEYSKALIKRRLAFKMNMVLLMSFQIMSPIIMLFVWTAIYLASGVSTISNFTLLQIATYFFVIAALNAMAPDISWGILGDVRSGNIFSILTRPLSYVWVIVSGAFANILFDTITVGIPILVLLVVFAHVSLTLSTAALFALSVLVMLCLTIMTEFLIGYIAFFFIDIGGLLNISNFVMQFLGGGMIPLNLLPSGISAVTSVLPFQFMLYTPAAIFTGAVSNVQAEQSLILGVLWLGIFMVLCYGMWYAAKRHIDAVGV